MDVLDSLVIGGGQAGLSASFHLRRRGIPHVVLDADARPGGAWQHRWDSLLMRDVHGVADLPGEPVPDAAAEQRANEFVPAYFAAYEQRYDLPVVRPVNVRTVRDAGDGSGLLLVETDAGTWLTRTLVNATGTWTHPFVPTYPGAATFAGEQLHTHDYPGPEHLRGRRVVVVGAGTSAVQHLGEVAPVAAATTWVTRRVPLWSTEHFTAEIGRAVVARVEERVRRGLPPEPVVRVTGLRLREQECEAERLGVYAARRPMFARIEPHGVRWADGSTEPADTILWATGFRAALDHLGPLRLRTAGGGIRIGSDGPALGVPTTALDDPRVQLVGYGPSASTIGANRAGLVAVRAVRDHLRATAETAA